MTPRQIRKTAEEHHGTVVKMLGDGSLLAFESARAAVRAAVDLQRASEEAPYDVRIGVHTGDVMRTGDDLLGLLQRRLVSLVDQGRPGQHRQGIQHEIAVGQSADVC